MGREPSGAAWSGEVEPQPSRSPPVGWAAPPASGQGVLRDSEPWLPALGGGSAPFAAGSTLGSCPARTEGSVFFFIAVWIGSQRDLVLNRGSRLRGSGFRGAGPSRPWHTLPLSRRPLCLPRDGRSTEVHLTGPDPGSVGCGERLPRVSEPLSSRIQQSLQHLLAPLASQDDWNSAGHVRRWVGVLSVPCPLSFPRTEGKDSGQLRPGLPAGERANADGRDGPGWGRYIGSGARGLSCPYLVSETSTFCSSCEPRNCGERVPDFVFARSWAKDVSGPPHDPTLDSCRVYIPHLVPNVSILLQAISKGAKRPHFPARSSLKLRRRALLSISRGAEGVGVGHRKNDLFRYSIRFRYRNSNSSPRRIRASRVTDSDSLTARGSRQSCHHPEGIQRNPVTAAALRLGRRKAKGLEGRAGSGLLGSSLSGSERWCGRREARPGSRINDFTRTRSGQVGRVRGEGLHLSGPQCPGKTQSRG